MHEAEKTARFEVSGSSSFIPPGGSTPATRFPRIRKKRVKLLKMVGKPQPKIAAVLGYGVDHRFIARRVFVTAVEKIIQRS